MRARIQPLQNSFSYIDLSLPRVGAYVELRMFTMKIKDNLVALVTTALMTTTAGEGVPYDGTFLPPTNTASSRAYIFSFTNSSP